MSRGINKVILVGNLGQDPEVRHTANGSAVTNITVATSESWTDKQSGQKQERTEWHRVVMFNKLGEIAGQYTRKGTKVYIEGSLRTRKWQNQQGQDQYTTEIVASDMQMLGGNPNNQQGAAGQPMQQPANQNYQQQPARQAQRPAQQPMQQGMYQQQQQAMNQGQAPAQQGQPQQQMAPAGGGFDDFDDDIPFAQFERGMIV